MKFGLRIPSFALGAQTATIAEMGDYLRCAEDLGFHSATCIDHVLTVPPYTTGTWLEPMVLMGALAAVTRTITLGPMGITLPLRNPVYYAKEWATLDVLSGGRAIFGVGVGWHEKEFVVMNVPYKERGRRMNEMLEAVLALWSGDDVTYRGDYYRFENVRIDPKPVQRPHPPIWIPGGTSPLDKAYGQKLPDFTPVLRRIAKYASVWIPHSPATPEMVRGDWARIQEMATACGRGPGDIEKAYCNFVYVLEQGEKPEAAVPKFSKISGKDLEFWQTHYLVGTPAEVAERVCEKVNAMGGVSHVIFNPVDWSMSQLELLAGEVRPLILKELQQ
jgi:probable F420-dependent oxidoreductase